MKPPIRARRALTAFLALALGLGLVAACGGGGGGGNSDRAAPATQPPDGATSGTQGSNEANIRRIAFVPPGPTDDDTPRGNQWYEFLTQGQCKALLDDVARANPDDPPVIIYRAAAEACTGQHTDAASDLNRYLAFGIPPDENDCGRDFVVAFVRDVLNTVKADPGANITFVQAGPRRPCETGTTVTTTAGRSTTTAR